MGSGQAAAYDQEKEQWNEKFLKGIHQIPLQSWVEFLDTSQQVITRWQGGSLYALASAIQRLNQQHRRLMDQAIAKGECNK